MEKHAKTFGQRLLACLLVLFMIIPSGLETIVIAAKSSSGEQGSIDLVVTSEAIYQAIDAWNTGDDDEDQDENTPQLDTYELAQADAVLGESVSVSLDTELVEPVEEFTFSEDAEEEALLKKELLAELDGAILVEYFGEDATGDADCAAIVAVDPESYELRAVFLNKGNETKTFTLTVRDGDQDYLVLSGITAVSVSVEVAEVEPEEEEQEEESEEEELEKEGEETPSDSEETEESSSSGSGETDGSENSGESTAEPEAGSAEEQEEDVKEESAGAGEDESAQDEPAGSGDSENSEEKESKESGSDSESGQAEGEYLSIGFLPDMKKLKISLGQSGELEIEDEPKTEQETEYTLDREEEELNGKQTLDALEFDVQPGFTVASFSLRSPRSGGNGIDDEIPASVIAQKWAEKPAGSIDEDGRYQVFLTAQGRPKKYFVSTSETIPTNLIIIMDLSGSMSSGTTGRWTKAKEATSELVDVMLGDGFVDPDQTIKNQIAMVGYAGNDNSRKAHANMAGDKFIFSQSAQDIKDIYQDKSTVGAMCTAAGISGTLTNVQAGVIAAKDVIATMSLKQGEETWIDEDGRQTFILLVSDGIPNRRYTNYPTTFTQAGDNITQAAVTEVAPLHMEAAAVFSLMIDATGTPGFMESMATSNEFYTHADRNALKEHFKQLGADIIHTQAKFQRNETMTIIDPMSEYVDFNETVGVVGTYFTADREWKKVQGSQPVFHKTYNSSGETLENVVVWTIPENVYEDGVTYRIEYEVEVKDQYAGQKPHKGDVLEGIPTDTTMGSNPNTVSNNTGQGVILNRKTTVETDLAAPKEIPVPIGTRPMVTTEDFRIKKADEGGKLLEGVDFVLQDSSGATWLTATTNSSGIAQFAPSSNAMRDKVGQTFTLYETKGLEGYQEKTQKLAEATVKYSGAQTRNYYFEIRVLDSDVTRISTKPLTYQVLNRKIPETAEGAVSVKKVIDSETGGKDTFNVVLTDSKKETQQVTLTPDVENKTLQLTQGETYTVTEPSPGSNFNLKNIAVTGTGISVKTFNAQAGSIEFTVTDAAKAKINIVVTNERKTAGDNTKVTVKKLIRNSADVDQAENFQITLQGTPNIPANKHAVTLKANETKEVKGLKLGMPYTVSEATSANYELVGITINGQTVGNNAFTLKAGDQVAIVVENKRKTTSGNDVTVAKVIAAGDLTGGAGTTNAGFTIVFSTAGEADIEVPVTAGGAVANVVGLKAGKDYTITEKMTNAGTNYQLAGVTIKEGAGQATPLATPYTFTAKPNTKIALTVSNKRKTTTQNNPQVTVKKIVENDIAENAQVAFDITFTNTKVGSDKQTVSVPKNGNAVGVGGLYVGETYKVSEKTYENYDLVGITINGKAVTGDVFTLKNDSDKIAIEVKNKRKTTTGTSNQVTIQKSVPPLQAEEAKNETFTVTFARKGAPGTEAPIVVTIKGDGTVQSVNGLFVGGTYTVTEANHATFEQVKIAIDGADYIPANGFTIPDTEAVVEIVVHNQRQTTGADAKVTARKEITNPAADAEEGETKTFVLTFTPKKGSPIIIPVEKGASAVVIEGLKVGETYTVTESYYANYENTEILINGQKKNTFTLETKDQELAIVVKNARKTTTTKEKNTWVTVKKVVANDIAENAQAAFEIILTQANTNKKTTLSVPKNGAEVVVSGLVYGTTYTVSEAAYANYELVGITINGQTVPNNAFTLNEGDKLAIVVRNKRQTTAAGDVTVAKAIAAGDLTGGAGTTNAGFTVVFSTAGEANIEVPVTAGGAVADVIGLKVGATYTITEKMTNAGTNYQLAGVTIKEGAGQEKPLATPYTFTVKPNTQIALTVSNKRETTTQNNPQVTVKKIVENDIAENAQAAFDITFTNTKVGSDKQTVSVPKNGNAVGVGGLYVGETYKVSEKTNENYDLVGITINGKTVSGNTFTLRAGDKVAIEVKNKRKTTTGTSNQVTIQKSVPAQQAEEAKDETFTVTFARKGAPASEAPIVVTIKGDGTVQSVNGLFVGGTYTVTEANHATFEQVGLTIDGVDYNPAKGLAIPDTEAIIEIVVENQRQITGADAKVTARKEITNPAADAEEGENKTFVLTFTPKKGSPIIIPVEKGASAVVIEGLKVGETYTVTEAYCENYENTEILINGQKKNTFTLETKDQELAIVVKNARKTTTTKEKDTWVSVEKVVGNDVDQNAQAAFDVVFTQANTGNKTTLSVPKNGEATAEGLVYGTTYTAREAAYEHYELVGITINGQPVVGDTFTFTLNEGDKIAVVVENARRVVGEGVVTVHKIVQEHEESAGLDPLFTIRLFAIGQDPIDVVLSDGESEPLEGLISGVEYIISEINMPTRYRMEAVQIWLDEELLEADRFIASADRTSIAITVTNRYVPPIESGGGGSGGNNYERTLGDGTWAARLTEEQLVTIGEDDVPLANIPDEAVPLAGGFPIEILGFAGLGTILGGLLIGRKKKEETDETHE